MRADDPAVLRAAWSLLLALQVAEPLYAEEVAIVVCDAMKLPDPLWWDDPRRSWGKAPPSPWSRSGVQTVRAPQREHELEDGAREAERVCMRLLAPGSEVHSEKFARMLAAALIRLPLSS